VYIDGKATAAELRARVGAAAADLKAGRGLVPGLAVILAGDDPASRVYVRAKAAATIDSGFHSVEHLLPARVGQRDLESLVRALNRDPAIHGILVQLPLPPGLDAEAVIAAIDPAKDVDGLHPQNVGALWNGRPGLVPCTPQGCLLLLRQWRPDVAGLDAVVIGRSGLVGKPIAGLLLAENCTVTIAHSRTADLPGLCRRADILIAAAGRPALVRGDWIKPGAAVVDVGINRVISADGKSRLIGDVATEEAALVAGAITPVPGGVGPMTIACLMRNTLVAACRAAGLAEPAL
jgi:methylenetetrahydrofolate dehydrogenase (NADP+)/methenyltetrahydrofolate cyclohydrolase